MRIDRHNLTALSAQISYYFCLALFPFLILLAAVIGLLPFTHLWDYTFPRIIQYFPQDVQGVLWDTIGSLVQAHRQFLSAGLVGTVWAATNGLLSLMSALNAVYEVPETRSFVRRLGVAITVLVVLILLLVATFAFLNAGSIFDQRLVSPTTSWLLPVLAAVARATITIGVALVAINLMDHILPDLRRPWRWVTPGTLVVAIGWLLGPLGFNAYILHVASYHKTYGVLGAFVILMVWFYVSSLIILVGAEINSQLHEGAKDMEKPNVGFVPAPSVAPVAETLPGQVPEGQWKRTPH